MANPVSYGMNLLPQKQKEELVRDTKVRFIKVLFSVVYLWAIIVLVISYNSVLYLNAQTPAIEERIERELQTEKSSMAQSIESEINELNSTLLNIDKTRKQESFNFPYILRVVGSVIPEGVVLKSIIFQNGAMNLRGHADTRAGVLLLKENLENAEEFHDVISPLSNIVKEENIDFNFSFSL